MLRAAKIAEDVFALKASWSALPSCWKLVSMGVNRFLWSPSFAFLEPPACAEVWWAEGQYKAL